MKVLITGNLGYVGPVVVRHLRRTHPQARLVGFDSAFFALSTTGAMVLPELSLDEQHFGDIPGGGFLAINVGLNSPCHTSKMVGSLISAMMTVFCQMP